MSSGLSAILCPFVALVYPAYASYKAVESPQPDDDTQWLMYWIITAMFQVAEIFGDYLLHWMPLYFEFKLVCLILLQNNTLRIPSKIYISLVRPFLQPREPAIDEWLASSYLNMMTSVTNGLQWAVRNGPGFLNAVSAGLHAASDTARKNAQEASQAATVRRQASDVAHHQKIH